MGEGGLEPPRSYDHWHLKPARLPFRHSPEQLSLQSSHYQDIAQLAGEVAGPLPSTTGQPKNHEKASSTGLRNLPTDLPRYPVPLPVGLQSVENGLGRMVEGVFSRAFKSNVRPIEIGRRMVREIDTKRTVDGNGRRVVPNHFLIRLSQADRLALADVEAALINELETAAVSYCADEGYHLRGPVVAVITEDPKLPKGRVLIESEVVISRADESRNIPERSAPVPDSGIDSPPIRGPRPSRSKLVLPSGHELSLGTQPVVIGRLPECDITLDDSNLSRRHAEVTYMNEAGRGGVYVLTDLGSTNGTKVNGTRLDSPCILHSGDVITVGLYSIHFEER